MCRFVQFCLAHILSHVFLAVTLKGDALEFELKQILNDTNTVEGFILQLAKRQSGLPIVVMHSRSLQHAEPEHPRVLYFVEELSAVFSFNSLASSRGYDSVEFLHFRYDENRFQLGRILAEGNQSSSLRIEHEPKICQNCHLSGNETRPIWDLAPFWRGLLGEGESYSDDDLKTFGRLQKKWRDSPRLAPYVAAIGAQLKEHHVTAAAQLDTWFGAKMLETVSMGLANAPWFQTEREAIFAALCSENLSKMSLCKVLALRAGESVIKRLEV
jgi:hypothetical protein